MPQTHEPAPVTSWNWRERSVVGVGEAMVEFAAVGDNLYRRGFAGDTLNTCWHIAHIVRTHARVGYFTRIGTDASSSQFLDFLTASELRSDAVSRDETRTMGLYVISLAGAERSFSYWRDSSAARKLADDFNATLAAIAGAGLIHISGITLAIIGAGGRRNLFKALDAARSSGSVVSFDPNVRPRLWPDAAEMAHALREALDVTDIALPSFDDEAALWGDADPERTARRIHDAGVREVAVKNGRGAVTIIANGEIAETATPAVDDVRDTTGAGDAFNAGYLAGRLVGMSSTEACGLGQSLAGEVIRHFGALAPTSALERFREAIRAQVARAP